MILNRDWNGEGNTRPHTHPHTATHTTHHRNRTLLYSRLRQQLAALLCVPLFIWYNSGITYYTTCWPGSHAHMKEPWKPSMNFETLFHLCIVVVYAYTFVELFKVLGICLLRLWFVSFPTLQFACPQQKCILPPVSDTHTYIPVCIMWQSYSILVQQHLRQSAWLCFRKDCCSLPYSSCTC